MLKLKIDIYKHLLKRYEIDWIQWEREITEYVKLIREWNDVAGLVSPKDAEEGCAEHIEDSLSLIDYIVPHLKDNPELMWLDIGSGGGFPVIPVLLAFKNMRTVLIERKIRKSNFLQMVLKKFYIDNAVVICDGFPDCVPKYKLDPGRVGIITARGVEKPERVGRFLSNWLSENTMFLCQSTQVLEIFHSEKFKLYQVDDAWNKTNPPLRKGQLAVIRKNISKTD